MRESCSVIEKQWERLAKERGDPFVFLAGVPLSRIEHFFTDKYLVFLPMTDSGLLEHKI